MADTFTDPALAASLREEAQELCQKADRIEAGAAAYDGGGGAAPADAEQLADIRKRLTGWLCPRKGLFAGDVEEIKFLLRLLDEREADIARLRSLYNTPETKNWFEGCRREAAHQQEHWGSEHDAGKSPFDWFWLVGYLAQKVADACTRGDVEKAKHHTISTAATMLNWHRQLSGVGAMRPGIEPPVGEVST